MKLDSLYVRESTQFKLGHSKNQIRPLGVETGQYPWGIGRNRPLADSKQASEQRNTNVASRTDGAGIGV
jgi:hypothetical protein